MSVSQKIKNLTLILAAALFFQPLFISTGFCLSPQSGYNESQPSNFFDYSDELIDLIGDNLFMSQLNDSNQFSNIHTEKQIEKFGPDNFVIKAFEPCFGYDSKTACFSALYLDLKADISGSEQTESALKKTKTNGSLLNITIYDTRPAGSNAILIGHLGIQDIFQEEILITQSMVSFNFEYYEGIEAKFKTLRDALEEGLSHAAHSFPLDDPDFIKSTAKLCAGLTRTDIIQCLNEYFAGKSLAPENISPLKKAFKEKRENVVRENRFFPSQLYQKKSFKAGGDLLIKGLNSIINIARRTGYKHLMLGVSLPDGFQNYLLYSQYGFKPLLINDALKLYYEQILDKYKTLRAEKTEKSLFNIMWKICDEFPPMILPMVMDLEPEQTNPEPEITSSEISQSA